LPPDGSIGWNGAVVDLSKTVTVYYKALPEAERVASLTLDEAGELEAQWCAYGTRHGPLVVLDAARKLVEMSAISGDPERWKVPHWDVPLDPDHEAAASRIAEALEIAWSIEGTHFNTVSDGFETHDDAAPHIARTLEQLEQLREATDEAIEALKRLP